MIDLVLDSHKHDLGGGFGIERALPSDQQRMVGPFVFFDHFGPATFQPDFPRSMDVRPHPHIGLSTVSYLFDGEITHRDSLATEAVIRPGEVNWMTAGRGITHSERFEHLRATGGPMHGIQAWVALPTEDEDCDPAFTHHGPDDLPTFEFGGLWARLIAGKAFGAEAKVETHSPMFYVHWKLEPGSQAQLPVEYPERAAFIASGSVEVEGRTLSAGQMAVFAAGDPILFTGLEPAHVMLLGGEPVGPRFLEWNFVSSSRDRIEQAKADWRAGRMKLPDLDHDEFIPLPDPSPRPNSIS